MRVSFPGFSAGEVSPVMEGRWDIPALKNACRKARNVIPGRNGALFQRPGFVYRGLAENQGNTARTHLIPFVASSDEAYVLEFSDERLRIWYNGALVITRSDATGQPGVISVNPNPLLIETPYAAPSLRALQVTMANDVMWLVHEDYPPQILTRYAEDGFNFQEMSFKFPPLQDENITDTTITPSGTTGTITLTASDPIWTADNVGSYWGIYHRRQLPYIELSLSNGSGTAGSNYVLSNQPANAETVSVGKPGAVRAYVWAATAEAAYSVEIGTDAAESSQNLVKAINGGPAGGFGLGTAAHPDVRAEYLGEFTGGIKAEGILNFTDNALTNGTPDEFSIGAQAYAFADVVTSGPAYRVKRGASLADSIQNAILAINATGVAGTNYTAGTLANTQVTADAAPLGNSLRVTANTAGSAGNAIQTKVEHTSRMSWNNSTLVNGADSGTFKAQVTAKLAGSAGNAITVSETTAPDGVWQPTPNFTGGADTVLPDPLPTLRVNGVWEVATLGRWNGTLTLEQLAEDGVTWKVLRTWESQNDNNVQATGTVSGEQTLRLNYTGAGTQDDDAPARATLTATDPVVYGLVRITGFTSTTQVTAEVIIPLYSTDPTTEWAEGSFSERRGYPSAVTLHQQRLVFGKDIRVIGSQTGGFDNFFRSDLADSSYQTDLAANVAAPIVSLVSQDGLIVLTEQGEYLMTGDQNGVITPGSASATIRTNYGAYKAIPLLIQSSVIFIQTGGEYLNEYQFEFQTNDYHAVDLTQLVDHFGAEGLRQLAWAPTPHSLIYAVTQDGSLLTLAYRRQDKMLAWSKATTPHGRFESVAVIPGSNEVSEVYVSVVRQLPDETYVRTIESTDITYWENLRAEGNAAVPSLTTLDGGVTASIAADETVMSGLDHLIGFTVQVLLNGCVHADRVVQPDGTISLDMAGITFDNFPVSTVQAGLAPGVIIQPMYSEVGLRDGTSIGGTWKVAILDFKFYKTGACRFADSETSSGYPVIFRKASDPALEAVPLTTDLRKETIAGGWRAETTITFTNRTALPLNLLGVVYEGTITSA